MAQQQMTSSQKALMLELKSLQEEPVEGFRITLVDESDLYNWEVAIFGPPNTLYEGGYFKEYACNLFVRSDSVFMLLSYELWRDEVALELFSFAVSGLLTLALEEGLNISPKHCAMSLIFRASELESFDSR
ncbi:ubiquitin-conjugating enzyme E2 pex4-like [Rhinatrema bivittatum]|uniref:ubiquitin-conjugating enzyme E2 pex4-like n=1 Tax=Rhinatrema bivittatum TaxID=194408 RepID=UPI00112EC232|nr:ubiquitin-conjugating enzyme E2 pex4-like [Rhinatrema bivittatum]